MKTREKRKKRVSNCLYCGRDTYRGNCCSQCEKSLIEEWKNNQPWGYWRK